MNKIDPKLDGMAPGAVRYVIAVLIFLLVAMDGKRSDGRDELIIAKGLKPRSGESGRAEGKRQTKAKMRIAHFHMVKVAGLEDKVADPGWRKFKLIAQQQAEVTRRSGKTGGRQRAFMHQVVLRFVRIKSAAQEPLRPVRLCVINTC